MHTTVKRVLNVFKPDRYKVGAYVLFWIVLIIALFHEESLYSGQQIIGIPEDLGSIWPFLPVRGHCLLETIGFVLFIPLGLLLFFLFSLGFKVDTARVSHANGFLELFYIFILLIILNWFTFCILWKIIEIFDKLCSSNLEQSK